MLWIPDQRVDTESFWLSLCPEMTIGATPDVTPLPAPQSAMLQAEEGALRAEGYVKFGALLGREEAAALAAVVTKMQETTGFPVFAFVYDAFWSLLLRVREVLEPVIGADFRVLPDFWAWWVAPDPNASGWRPHRDRDLGTVRPDGTPEVVSAWFALSDATPENGCIYVLPASRDRRYHSYGRDFARIEAWPDIRALPVPAGSLLVWTHQLLHWGGRSSARAAGPRISIAFELQRADAKAYAKPLLDPATPPSFQERLGLIAEQLHQYRHMVELSPAQLAWSRKVRKRRPLQRSFADVFAKVMARGRNRQV